MAGVTVKRLITDRQFTDRGIKFIGQWAEDVTRLYIRPKTPMDTGELRASLGQVVRATMNKDISVLFYAEAPHAEYLEDVDAHGAHIAAIVNFTTPGTEAPFLKPNVERAAPTIAEAVARMFGS